MADIKDKQYSDLKEDLELLGEGCEKHKDDEEHPLPKNLTQERYQKKEAELTKTFLAAQAAQSALKNAMNTFHAKFNECEDLKDTDSRAIKGIFTIYNPDLRDFGIQPEKKRTRKNKKDNP